MGTLPELSNENLSEDGIAHAIFDGLLTMANELSGPPVLSGACIAAAYLHATLVDPKDADPKEHFLGSMAICWDSALKLIAIASESETKQ